MTVYLQRREFIVTLGGIAATWPRAVGAQQSKMPVIGLLRSTSPQDVPHFVAAFRQGLSETGYIEGRNVAIEYSWPRNRNDSLPSLAAYLAQAQVAVIFASGGTAVVVAAKGATSTIPIVFVNGGDPIKSGIVTSLNRPGGNITGVTVLAAALGAKKLGLLRELVGSRGTIGILANPNNADAEAELVQIETAAGAIGQQVEVLRANNDESIQAAFAALIAQKAIALIVSTDPFFYSRRDQIVVLAARHALPTIYDRREFAASGGLISYGSRFEDAHRQAGVYTGRILKGAKAADLPIVQPTKFEFVINLRTAKAIGLTFPSGLLAIADEVIE